MAEPRAIEPDGAEQAPVGSPRERVPILTQVAHATDAIVRVLRPESQRLNAPIAWWAPTDGAEEVRNDLYDELHEDLYHDLHDELHDELHDQLRGELHEQLRVGVDADLDELRDDLYDEIDDLRDDVFAAPAPVTALPKGHFQTDDEVGTIRARRVAFIVASVLSLALVAAIVLVWQRADSVRIEASRPPAVAVAPPDLDAVIAHVDQIDQQMVGLLAVSATPATPQDVSLQIEALRADLAGVQGCLRAFRRALDSGVSAASAIEYC